jgi:hypothetical protein
METKYSILKALAKEFELWQKLLAGMNEQQILIPLHPSQLSVKDIVAHLHTWQTISIARTDAALQGIDPILPDWPEDLDPESDDDLDSINAWIYDTNKNLSWSEIYRHWNAGFLHFMQIGEAISESAMVVVGKYRWLENYALSDVFTASGEHHAEHRAMVLSWMDLHNQE